MHFSMLIPVIGTEALAQQGDAEAVERTSRQTGEAGQLQDCGEREVWSTEQSAAYTL